MFGFKSELIDQLEKEFHTHHGEDEGGLLSTSFRNSLINAVMLVLEDLAPELPLSKIESKISALQALDYAAINDFINLLEKHPPKLKSYRIGKREPHFYQSIERAKSTTKKITQDEAKFSAEAQATKLRYGSVSRDIDELLYFYERAELPTEARAFLTKKIGLLNRSNLYEIWGHILREFDPERIGSNFFEQRSLLPRNFLEDSPELELPAKIATYLIDIKHQIIKHRLSENPENSSYPADIPTVAQLLALNASTAERVLPIEELVVILISRLFFFWSALLFRDKMELAGIMGLGTESKIVNGIFIQDETHELKESNYREQALLALGDLKKLSLIGEDYLTKIPNLENALIRYKLGLEVGLPKLRDKLEEWFDDYSPDEHEKELQKKICRYLLDQGIYSFGKKFGRDEIDLITHQNPNVPYVIEVKIYRQKPKEKDIKKHLSQLHVYMDKEQPGRKGILVIYNFSGTLISNENTIRWFKDKYWIVPINFGRTASKTRSTLIIREGKGTEIIECYTNAAGD